ncbi:Glyoxylase, beta-lactamase superfamily II [Ectothiorhodosinus mongolicus]|uniref:Glyoxylase, beta-lactamase superfamily II n=2 Tax=Ectothiorhodosinus mongolicus TaxID=233100 RepID=A0A1R3VMK9_9GAMM|nr:Glyoxylase, beta-lactamase superfamily II [Ectothiorhodosinus mongolicus]
MGIKPAVFSRGFLCQRSSSTPERPCKGLASRGFIFALLFALLSMASSAKAADRSLEEILQPIDLGDGVYYFYGSLENRTPLNQGVTNNIGFVVTDAGVVLIDSGPSHQVAAQITEAVASMTAKPIVQVVSLGSQDHRWLGNDYFVSHGAELIALTRTATTQANTADQHVQRLTRALGEEALAGTVPKVAEQPIDADRHEWTMGQHRFALVFAGDGHFPGDAMLHLPDQGIVFTGDIVYTERMLGIHPWTNPVEQLAAFDTMVGWNPRVVVPGHGAATDVAEATRDTGDYLRHLVTEVRQGIENWENLDEVVERLADLPQFQHLRHYDDWHRMNINRTYLFIEQNP